MYAVSLMPPSSPFRAAPWLALLLALPACSDGEDASRADLLLLSTSNVNGYVEPCGCVAGQIGGIDRLAGYVQDELAKNPASLFVDCGDLIAEDAELDKSVVAQLPHKAEAFVSTWADIGCAAIAVGEMELAHLGPELMLELSERHGVPFVCGNVVDAQGKDVFPRYVIVERGGKRIGIFSLLAKRLKEAKVKEPENIDVGQLLRRRGLRVLDWEKRAGDIVAELLPKTDMILCASHLGFDLNRVLAKTLPQVDLVFGGHFGTAKQGHKVVRDTPVLVSQVRGSRVDRVEWWWPDEDSYFLEGDERGERGHGSLIDASEFVRADMAVEIQEREYAGMVRRELLYLRGEYRQKLADKTAQLGGAVRLRNELPERPTGNRFAHIQVPMHRDLRRSDIALTAVDEYHESVHAMWTEDAKDSVLRESEAYVGSVGCEGCHPGQVEFWRATRHSFALSALESTRQEVDAECFPCHTVGWGRGGGFLRPGRHQGFENVECAACHGPTGAHVLGGASYFMPNLISNPSMETCAGCHNSEHDPPFEREFPDRWGRVACGKMEPPEKRTTLMRKAAIEAAETLSRAPEPPWELISRAYMMADLPARSLAVAESWFSETPDSIDTRMVLADRLLDANRGGEARQHYAFVTERAPANARAWAGLARSLAHSNEDLALNAAREAMSLEPSNLHHARLPVEILLAQGRLGAATELAGALVKENPNLYTILHGLVELQIPTVPTPPDAGEVEPTAPFAER